MFVSLNHTDKDLHQLDKVHWTQTITFPLFLWSCFCILIYQNLNFQPTPWFQQYRRVLTNNFVLLRCVTPGGNFTGNTLLLWKKSFVRKAALCKSLVFFPVWLEFMWTGDHNLLPWLHYFWSCYEIILVVFFFSPLGVFSLSCSRTVSRMFVTFISDFCFVLSCADFLGHPPWSFFSNPRCFHIR